MKPTPEQPESADAAFLAAYDPSQFERPSVAVDVVLMTLRAGRPCALLVRRSEAPERGAWALPGGFVRMDESLDQAARRVLADKAGLRELFVEQLYTFGAPGRDPRTRVISVAYYALVELGRIEAALAGAEGRLLAELVVPGPDPSGAALEVQAEGASLELAFDHAEILGLVVQRLRGKLDYAPIGFELLPREFTLRQLQSVHEAVLGRPLNKDSFRRRMLASGRLEATGAREEQVLHRPAELYRYRPE